MQDFFKSVLFKILLVISAALVGLIIFSASTGSLLAPEQLIGIISKPFSEIVTGINSSVSDFFDQIFNSGKYKEESELLKDEIANMQKKIVDYEQIKGENEHLKEAIGIKSENKDIEIEVADVIARSPDNLFGFTINVGAKNGISSGMPVITKRGLIGLTTKVGETYAEVSTILSLDTQVAAISNGKNEIGIVNGQTDLMKDGLCAMFHLKKETALEPGDIISTSGGGLYPANIVIGTVKEIRINQNGMSSYAIIIPSEDILSVKNVSVIKNFKNQNFKMPNN